MSAIERCIGAQERAAKWALACLGSPELAESAEKLVEAARAELAGYTEIGPCSKHLKMFWVSTVPVLPPELQIGPVVIDQSKAQGYCSLCCEIEQAVERKLSRHHCDYCKQDISGQEFDGHYTIFCHKPNCIEQAVRKQDAEKHAAEIGDAALEVFESKSAEIGYTATRTKQTWIGYFAGPCFCIPIFR